MEFTLQDFLSNKSYSESHTGGIKRAFRTTEIVYGKPVTELRKTDASRLFTMFDELGLSIYERNKILFALRAFFKWGIENNLYDGENPMLDIEKIRGPKLQKKVQYIHPNDFTKLQAALWRMFNHSLRLRRRYDAIYTLMYHAGLRRTEILELKVDDILKKGLIINKDTKKERFIPLNHWILRNLRNYIKWHNKTELIFDDVSSSQIFAVLRMLEDKVGFKVTPDSLRYSFGVNLLDKTNNKRLVKETLGYNRKKSKVKLDLRERVEPPNDGSVSSLVQSS